MRQRKKFKADLLYQALIFESSYRVTKRKVSCSLPMDEEYLYNTIPELGFKYSKILLRSLIEYVVKVAIFCFNPIIFCKQFMLTGQVIDLKQTQNICQRKIDPEIYLCLYKVLKILFSIQCAG